QHRAKIAGQRRQYIAEAFIERISRADSRRFLTETAKQPADDLALLEQIVEPVFERPRQPHEIEQVELLSLFHEDSGYRIQDSGMRTQHTQTVRPGSEPEH